MFLSIISRIVTLAFFAGVATQAFASPVCSPLCTLYAKATVERPLKILIVPGHEPSTGGAWFRSYTERDINLRMAEETLALLRDDPSIQATTTRVASGWTATFANYFRDGMDAIADFRSAHIAAMAREYQSGTTVRRETGTGSKSDLATSLRLFGVNKWANENAIDLIINLHVNDYSGRPASKVGVYDGLVIYIPDGQYANSSSSALLAQSLYQEIHALMATSTRPQEKKGIVEDQDLTALGAHRTLTAPSVLIEYGYIYEGFYRQPSVRDAFVSDLARATVRGLYHVLEVSDITSNVPMPFVSRGVPKSGEQSLYVYQIQRKLAERGLYPPSGSTLEDCPFSGIFAGCTYRSLLKLQKGLGFADVEIRSETMSALEGKTAMSVGSR